MYLSYTSFSRRVHQQPRRILNPTFRALLSISRVIHSSLSKDNRSPKTFLYSSRRRFSPLVAEPSSPLFRPHSIAVHSSSPALPYFPPILPGSRDRDHRFEGQTGLDTRVSSKCKHNLAMDGVIPRYGYLC